ncbi:putative transporter C22E12.01 [Pseudocercospora fuligena]|uniref:Putative transporter C22E12.01 n=1 Tax=Pseudocercospora fuligena TaxID=685502 RepID=A0A8H6RUJ3_9PEZI|nr:putative transporter C22E12.01 [Pseudocercospora fuligena]
MEMSSIHSSDAEDLTDDEETGLTQTERKKRRRRKRQDAEPANRIAGDKSLQAAEEEKGIAKATMIRRLVINGLLIGLWYSFSISISVYNKWMFSAEMLDFHFPLFTTSLHMLVQFSLASAVIFFLPQFRPGRDGTKKDIHEYQRVGDESQHQQHPPPDENVSKKPLMTKSFYLTRIAPCGTATALDIGLGNFSLRFISLTFFTMCKSSVLAFVLLFAFIFRLESPTWKLCAIILFMTIGVILMVSGEATFNALGFILVMTASFCSGLRWSLTQILLLRNPATSNPFSSIFFLTPSMFLILFLLALPIEGVSAVLQGIRNLSADHNPFLAAIILLFPGCLAFLMVAAEFALLKRTSVVTLSVCGIFKEVLTISAASVTFGDELSPINVSGLVVTIASIAAYNWLKYSKMQKEANREAHQIVEAERFGVESMEGRAARRSLDEEDEDAFAIGRDSTSSRGGLMRDSLHLATNLEGTGASSDGSHNGAMVHSPSKSPIKRPENLE